MWPPGRKRDLPVSQRRRCCEAGHSTGILLSGSEGRAAMLMATITWIAVGSYAHSDGGTLMHWLRPGTLTRRRAVIALLVTVLCILFNAAFLSARAQERRIALVIGNAHYQHVPQLDNPTNDAKLIAATLGRLGFELVGGKPQLDLNRDRLQAVIRAFGEELGPNTVALFYYSGHGLQIDGTNYLVPVDANLERVADADFELLPADLILKQMDRRG